MGTTLIKLKTLTKARLKPRAFSAKESIYHQKKSHLESSFLHFLFFINQSLSSKNWAERLLIHVLTCLFWICTTVHKVDCDSEKVQKNFANFSLCDRVVSKASHTLEVNGIFHHHIKAFIACLLNIHTIKLRKINWHQL